MKKFVIFLVTTLMLTMPVFAAGESTVKENDDGTKTLIVKASEETFTKEQLPDDLMFKDMPEILNIRARLSKTRNTFLKFDVKGLENKKIKSIQLRVTNGQFKKQPPEGAKTGGDTSFVVVKVNPNSWRQEELTYNNSPALDEFTGKIGEKIQEGSMKYMEDTLVDISPDFINGDAVYSMALIPTQGEDDNQWFSTRDPDVGTEKGPALLITYEEGGNTMIYTISAIVAVVVIAGVVFFVLKKIKKA